MAPAFNIVEHVIPGQHIREYPNATKHSQEDVLQLSIKEYIPSNPPEPVPHESLTIIGAHGNGFPKETYEPFWDELYFYLQSRGVHVRSIWMADSSNQGASGVLNEDIQGDSSMPKPFRLLHRTLMVYYLASWFDHSRDLLLMINHFRDAMPRPIVGIAHSMGCAQLVNLSIMHPRLLSALILIEPVILDESNAGPSPALLSTTRRDIWDTRAKAETALRKAFAAWDQRALESFLQYGLRAVPTAIYNTSLNRHISPESVTLTTSKHQEAWAYAQVNFEPKKSGLDRLLLPDWDPVIELPHLASRPECLITMRNLPYLRPSVLYVFGAKSPLSLPVFQEKKVRMTGIGVGGNGGVAEAKVEKEVLQGSGHLVVFEKPDEAACVTAGWIQRWLEQWVAEEKILRDHKSKKSDDSMLRMSQLWVEYVKLPANASRAKATKL